MRSTASIALALTLSLLALACASPDPPAERRTPAVCEGPEPEPEPTGPAGVLCDGPPSEEALDTCPLGALPGPADAAEALDAGVPTLPDAGRARRLAVGAVDALGAGRFAEAAAGFDAVASGWPLLETWARALRAEALRRAGRLEEAIAEAGRVPTCCPHGVKAVATRARALRALGRSEEAIAVLRAFERASGPSTEAHMLLADMLAGGGRTGEAIDELLAMDALFPLTEAAERALDRVLELVAPPRASSTPVSRYAKALLARGTRLFNAHRSELAAQTLERAAARLPVGSPARCEALLRQARSWDKLRDRSRSLPVYQRVAAECAGWEGLGAALFAGGRAAYRAGELDAALALFAQLHAEAPDHSTNDDALLYEAHIHRDRGDEPAREQALQAIVDGRPDGDMRHDAAFLLVWDRWRAGDAAGALAAADGALSVLPPSGPPWALGRIRYWRARALAEVGRTAAALAELEDVLAACSLSWYGQLALARIAELGGADAARAAVARAEDRARALPGIGGAIPTAAWSSTPWLQAVTLARMGLWDGARRSLTGLPGATEDEVDWMLALLAERLDAPTVAVPIARHLQDDLVRTWPAGPNRVRWQVAYPRPFDDLVPAAAREAGTSAALAFAIMREESGFHERIESWANALGLMQLLLPTARWLARNDDGRVDRGALLEADLNVALGTRLLGRLQARLGHPALAVAAYNAGEGAVRGWLLDEGPVPLDELVEAIPYVQTRRYTKRVMTSRAAYRTLTDGGPPLLELTVPRPATPPNN